MRHLLDIEAFEKRAAIAEFDRDLTREDAEDLAAKDQGYRDGHQYWEAVADYVLRSTRP